MWFTIPVGKNKVCDVWRNFLLFFHCQIFDCFQLITEPILSLAWRKTFLEPFTFLLFFVRFSWKMFNHRSLKNFNRWQHWQTLSALFYGLAGLLLRGRKWVSSTRRQILTINYVTNLRICMSVPIFISGHSKMERSRVLSLVRFLCNTTYGVEV
jgi:hypothetical protein